MIGYCGSCGQTHELTAICPNAFQPVYQYSTMPLTPTNVEIKLDRIIELLEQIVLKGAKY